MQCVAVCCSVLQCVAARCSVLQCVADYLAIRGGVCCSVLQICHSMTQIPNNQRWSVLQCVAVCCSVSQTTWRSEECDTAPSMAPVRKESACEVGSDLTVPLFTKLFVWLRCVAVCCGVLY